MLVDETQQGGVDYALRWVETQHARSHRTHIRLALDVTFIIFQVERGRVICSNPCPMRILTVRQATFRHVWKCLGLRINSLGSHAQVGSFSDCSHVQLFPELWRKSLLASSLRLQSSSLHEELHSCKVWRITFDRPLH